MQMKVDLAGVAVLIRIQCWLVKNAGKRKDRTVWWLMAKSFAHFLCFCAPSTHYHIVSPSFSTFNKPVSISLWAHNAASWPGFSCQGNCPLRRHPMTAEGEAGSLRGRVGDVALALSVLQGAPDPWPSLTLLQSLTKCTIVPVHARKHARM